MLMANSADPDQLVSSPTDLDLHCLQRQDISGFSRTRVNRVRLYSLYTGKLFSAENKTKQKNVPYLEI